MGQGKNVYPQDFFIMGKRVHAWTGGTGPGLLLLHSAWGDAEMSWSAVWNDLSRSFTVVAPDMPGFARSDPPDAPSLAESARRLIGLLDSLKLDRAVVAGNSFGVAVAIELASAFPDRIAHLLVMNGGYIPFVPGLLKKILSLHAVEKSFRRFMRSMTYSARAFAKAFPNQAAMPPGFFDCIRSYEDRHSRIVFDTVMNRTRPQDRSKVPATVIWGTGDRLTSMKQAKALRKWLGNPAFVLIEGAGHMPQVERPDEFVQAVMNVGIR